MNCLPVTILVSRQLELGRIYSAARLRDGWHGPEDFGGTRGRWTDGDARCFLRVNPNESGMLRIRLRLENTGIQNRAAEVDCNGVSAQIVLESVWQEHAFPVRADDAGFLQVRIRSARWRPVEFDPNSTDSRQLGCCVERIWLESEAAEAAWAPATATVIIPTQNRCAILRQCLERLRGQTWRDFEVIVVDDGSEDGTWNYLSQELPGAGFPFPIRVFRQERGGAGAARNAGTRMAEGDVVIFLGDDILASADLLEQHMVRHREIGELCAVVGYTEWDRDRMKVTPFLEFLNQAGYQFAYGKISRGEVGFGCFYTSNVSIPREVLGAAPFSSAFRSVNWEDTELGYRLARGGLPFFYEPSARTTHLHSQRMVDFVRRQHAVGFGVDVLFQLHPELKEHPDLYVRDANPPFPWGALAAAPLLPFWAAFDSMKIRLPRKLYHAICDRAFVEGFRKCKAEKALSPWQKAGAAGHSECAGTR